MAFLSNAIKGWALFYGIDGKTLVGVDYTNDNTCENILFGAAEPIDIYNPTYCDLSCIALGPYVNWRVKQ